jgi:flagellar biosynthesis/type III secretory pathway protein FliH
MRLNNIVEQIEQVLDEAFDDGFAEGQEEGFNDGVQTEHDRVQSILDMMIGWAMEKGKGTEVIILNRVKETITPVEVDYSIEAYQEELEKDGF